MKKMKRNSVTVKKLLETRNYPIDGIVRKYFFFNYFMKKHQ